jgi:hypothetical protein
MGTADDEGKADYEEALRKIERALRAIANDTPGDFGTAAAAISLDAMVGMFQEDGRAISSRVETVADVQEIVARVGLELSERFPLDEHTMRFLRTTKASCAQYRRTKGGR